MAKIKITQIKSVIDRSERQKKTVEALGLKKINQSVEVEATPAIIGMVRKVNHLITVEEIAGTTDAANTVSADTSSNSPVAEQA